ncbi:MAG: flagellar motor protein MotD [Methylohalobius sp.]|nr:flagellar motor protein MotD [Methylohalobius sp.]
MRRRKVRPEEEEKLERWLVSYADFITLLFAFFVVMYAISIVNKGDFKVLSESLDQAFQARPEEGRKVPEPIQVGETPRRLDSAILEAAQEAARLREAASRIEEVLAPYIDQELVAVEHNEFWIAVEMKSAILFASGSAELSPEASSVLAKLAEVVRELPDNPVYIEGHTDNVPIETARFPSNWELSAARSASVVRRLIEHGVNPARLAAVGFGEHHPVADNAEESGRYRNRRVVLVLQAKNAARYRFERP